MFIASVSYWLRCASSVSVLTVDEVEKRIGGVPGVDSATVNYAAGNATVRYDETRLEVADIKDRKSVV